MNKYIFSILAMSSLSTFAADLSDFQAFDNEINVGFGLQQDQSTQPDRSGSSTIGNNQVYSLEGERILNNGIYIDVLANMAFTSTPTNNQVNPVISNYGVNGKVGYVFEVANTHLLLTPYGLLGLNNNGLQRLNTATQAVTYNPSLNVGYFYTYGLGGRIEYRINDTILVYADQNYMMSLDQTQYGSSSNAMQNYNSAMSTLGAKFNLVDLFQLGVRAMYTTYMPQTSNSGGTGITLAQPESSMSAMVTLGLTF